MKKAFKIALRSDAYEPTSFKLSIMTDTSRFYISEPFRMNLTFAQDRWVARKLDIMQSL